MGSLSIWHLLVLSIFAIGGIVALIVLMNRKK